MQTSKQIDEKPHETSKKKTTTQDNKNKQQKITDQLQGLQANMNTPKTKIDTTTSKEETNIDIHRTNDNKDDKRNTEQTLSGEDMKKYHPNGHGKNGN